MMSGKKNCRPAHPGQRPLLPILCIIALCSLLMCAAGCYTRFAEFEPVNVNAAADTVAPQDSEICIWERDLTGYPRLRCYPSYYPRQWYIYNHSPWWYHNSSHLYNAEKCPPYYYYDDNCGCCRYYLNNPDLARSSGGSGKDGVVRKIPDTTVTQDTDRVSITVSSGTSIHIPLKGNTAPASPDALPAASQPVSAQGTADSLAAANTADSLAAGHRRDTMPVVPVNRLRRSLRGR